METSDPAFTVDDDEALRVGRGAVGFFRERLEEAFDDDFVGGFGCAGQKFPVCGIGAKVHTVFGEDFGGIMFGIDGEAGEFHAVVDFFKFSVEFGHPSGDERARTLAAGKNEISDPDFAFEV